jgi:hypothetical protein
VRTTVRLLSLLTLMLLVSCSRGPDKQILGRWQEAGTSSIATFHEDNTVELSTGKGGASGKFSFITPNKLKLELMVKSSMIGPQVYEVTISSNKMTWTDVDRVTTEFSRIK